jgi:hypothetical protein
MKNYSYNYPLRLVLPLFILINILASCSNNKKSSEYIDHNTSSIWIEEVSNENSLHNSTNYISDEDEETQINEQNLYERTSGAKDVEACNDRTWQCYDVEAEVSDWEVEQINFSNWWHLGLDWASLDEAWEANGESYTDSEWPDWDSWSITCDDC